MILPHLRQAEAKILDSTNPLGAVDDTALGRWDDFAARQIHGLHSHALKDLGDDARLAALHALEVLKVLDRSFEPTKRLWARSANWERHYVKLEDIAIELPVQLHA